MQIVFQKVILKDLEVLAEIASSRAGQTDLSESCDGANKTQLHIPEGGKQAQKQLGAGE